MVKSIAAALTALLLVASSGYAANMQVNASAVPVSGGTITPSGIKFYSAAQPASYSVAPKPGWTLTKVQIDGTVAVAPYTVPFDTSKIHTVQANYTQNLYSINTTTGAGGSAMVTGGGKTNIQPGATRNVVVAPATGYQLDTLAVDSIPVAPADPKVAYTTTFSAISASHTVNATFKVIPSATVSAGTNQTIGTLSTALTGSVTSKPAASAFLWAVTSGPAGASFINGATLTPTFVATAVGTYSVTLRVTVSGVSFTSAPATITVVYPGVISAGSKDCITCHSGATPVVEYRTSGHAKSVSGPSCARCHSGSHPVVTVTSAACESCHAAKLSTTTHPADLTAMKCLGCHDSHDPAAGIANLGPAPAHPAVTLYTYEEVGMQMAGGAKVPVKVDASGKGMPYSPKQTCGTAGCHVKNGVDYTYDKISDHAFHSSQGRPEYVDSADGKFDATKNKPWGQSTAMVGKW